ncbi:hydrogenase maturation nickel metallochaperone HypA [Eggerthellaceae bacterium zg-1084]|uniref:Hydrogenase maturation factor HypA n=1 Tax=Berryella wangjianweii TaxID=2734634 RepID=A0A6M8IWW7_9ACTN|nr:hydrogenase maturation nickel metallochaperone HypA [Berryella wangjianweii]NPD30578.1 hydrogenase maturation nickel metallochaperone HypA [Berryella wangjianweii]NPD32205.1 hydrogenase maturation nickel metallochaperone HypA [Eggerthellaceae bacterium zg-997]QKF07235.1 hydrogenase maturation nickel metallochaperone HypA [Berryella wangjianweii]
MHELGIMSGVLDAVTASAAQAGAERVTKVVLSIGEMTEAIDDALQFSFEVLSEGTLCAGAELQINRVMPRSLCLECGAEFQHDRFHRFCSECGSYSTDLIAGRELQVDSIEVDLPDDQAERP